MSKKYKTYQEFRTAVMKLVADSKTQPKANRTTKDGKPIYVVGRRELREAWKAHAEPKIAVETFYE